MDEENLRLLVSSEGTLRIPLYHGTSSFFLPSILQSGLGSVNIFEEYSLKDRAARLLEKTEAYGDVEDWLTARGLCAKLAREPVEIDPSHTGGFNFRYGGVYVTPSRQTAVRYAQTSRLGSEALAILFDLLTLISKTDPTLMDDDDSNLFHTMKDTETHPVLIVMENMPVRNLRAEQGGDPHVALRWMASLLAEEPDLFEDLAGQSNFELLEPLPPDQFQFEQIDH